MPTRPIWLLTCVGVHHDLPLLPHWLRHYLELGIDPDRILVILNATASDAPGLDRARRMLWDHGVTRSPQVWIAPYTSGSMWEMRAAVQSRICASDDWVLNADVDEFQRWPEPLANCLDRAERLRADCVQGVMLDRLAPDGTLAPVRERPHIFEQFPIRAEVAWSIGGSSPVHGRGGTVKMMAARARHLPFRGGHRPATAGRVGYLYRCQLGWFREIEDPAFRFSVPTQVDHIHWTDTLPMRLEKRLATPGVSPAGAEYGRRQLDHFADNGGIDLSQIALERDFPVPATPWTDQLEQLRRIGRRKPVTRPIRRRLSGRRARWLLDTAGRLIRAAGIRS